MRERDLAIVCLSVCLPVRHTLVMHVTGVGSCDIHRRVALRLFDANFQVPEGQRNEPLVAFDRKTIRLYMLSATC